MIIPTGAGAEVMEIFYDTVNMCERHDMIDCHCGSSQDVSGYFYAFGQPGCLYDSDIIGPFDSEQEAIDSANTTFDLELRTE